MSNALSVETHNISVITTAEDRHQLQVAPIKNGSKVVRYIEKRIPKRAIYQMPRLVILFHSLGPYCLANQKINIRRYPMIPSIPMGSTPKRRA